MHAARETPILQAKLSVPHLPCGPKPHPPSTAHQVSRRLSGGPDWRAGREPAARPTGGLTWCRVASALGALMLTSVTCTTASDCCGEAAGEGGVSRAWGHPRAPGRGGPTPGTHLGDQTGHVCGSHAPPPPRPGVTEQRSVTSDPCLQVTYDPKDYHTCSPCEGSEPL